MGVLPPNLDMLRLRLAITTDDKAAWSIIEHYFQCFHEEEAQEELWLVKTGILIDEFTPPANLTETEHENRQFFLEFTMMLVEAVHRLYVNHKRSEDEPGS